MKAVFVSASTLGLAVPFPSVEPVTAGSRQGVTKKRVYTPARTCTRKETADARLPVRRGRLFLPVQGHLGFRSGCVHSDGFRSLPGRESVAKRHHPDRSLQSSPGTDRPRGNRVGLRWKEPAVPPVSSRSPLAIRQRPSYDCVVDRQTIGPVEIVREARPRFDAFLPRTLTCLLRRVLPTGRRFDYEGKRRLLQCARPVLSNSSITPAASAS